MTTVSGWDLVGRAARRIGGRTGTIGTGTTATSVILNGLIGTTGDDTQFQDDRLFFPDNPTAVRQERLITTWTDATGAATVPTLTSAPTVGDRYILSKRMDYNLNEYTEALNECLRRTPYSYRTTIPLVPVNPIYPLTQLDWLRGAGDVDAVWWSQSWNMLTNEEFAYWHNGAAAAPDFWTLSGSGAAVARITGFGYGGYAAQVTRSGADAFLYQAMFPNVAQWLTRVSTTPYQVFPGAWVTCDTANAARIEFWDNGTLVSATDYHTGSGVPELLALTTGTPLTSAMSNTLQCVCAVRNTNTSAAFQRMIFWTGQTLPQQMGQYGSRFWWESNENMPLVVRNEGGSPIVEIPRQWMGMLGQLVVSTRRYFPELTTLDDEFDDQYAEVLKAGLIRYLVWASKPGQDRTRLDRILSEEANIWQRYCDNIVDRPVPRPPLRRDLFGA